MAQSRYGFGASLLDESELINNSPLSTERPWRACHDCSFDSIGKSNEQDTELISYFRASTDTEISINIVVQLSGLHVSGLIETDLWQPSKSSTLIIRPLPSISTNPPLAPLPKSAPARRSRAGFLLSEEPPELWPRPSLPTTKRSAMIFMVPARATYPGSDSRPCWIASGLNSSINWPSLVDHELVSFPLSIPSPQEIMLEQMNLTVGWVCAFSNSQVGSPTTYCCISICATLATSSSRRLLASWV